MVGSGYSKNRTLMSFFRIGWFLLDWIGYFFRIGSVISFGLDISNIEWFIGSRQRGNTRFLS
jgi:hypothetical protein